MLNNTFRTGCDDDLRVFLLYVNDLLNFYKITEYRLLKDCNIRDNFFSDVRRQLRGETDRRTKFSLWLLILINREYPFYFDLPRYLSLLDVSPNSNEYKTIETLLTKQKKKLTKKAANKLILTASI